MFFFVIQTKRQKTDYYLVSEFSNGMKNAHINTNAINAFCIMLFLFL